MQVADLPFLNLQLANMSIEMTMLVLGVILGLFQLLIAARAANSQRGLRWNLGARDAPPPAVRPVAARLERAFRNFMETFPFFAVAVIVAALIGRHNWATILGSEVYVAARILYLPLYAAGVPVVRTLVWVAATLSIILIVAALLWPQI